MPKVSVIIPIYGVEKYIERCSVSLFEQTLDNIEYIFVNDCTPDRSMEILESIIEKYRLRFKAEKKTVRIEQMPTNSGLPAVRRHGVQLATGDYIIHCDSDDWVDVDMYRRLYQYAIDKYSDLVFCDCTISNGNKSSERVISKNITNCSREVIFERLLTSYDLNPVWSAMAKRELYEDMMFPVGAMSEDKTIMIQLAWKAKNASYLPEPLYHYFLSDTSIIRTVNKEANIRKFKQSTDNRYILLNFFEREKIEISPRKLDALIFLGKFGYLESFLDDPECERLWTETFPMSVSQVLFNPYINIKLRLKYLLCYGNKDCCCMRRRESPKFSKSLKSLRND